MEHKLIVKEMDKEKLLKYVELLIHIYNVCWVLPNDDNDRKEYYSYWKFLGCLSDEKRKKYDMSTDKANDYKRDVSDKYRDKLVNDAKYDGDHIDIIDLACKNNENAWIDSHIYYDNDIIKEIFLKEHGYYD